MADEANSTSLTRRLFLSSPAVAVGAVLPNGRAHPDARLFEMLERGKLHWAELWEFTDLVDESEDPGVQREYAAKLDAAHVAYDRVEAFIFAYVPQTHSGALAKLQFAATTAGGVLIPPELARSLILSLLKSPILLG